MHETTYQRIPSLVLNSMLNFLPCKCHEAATNVNYNVEYEQHIPTSTRITITCRKCKKSTTRIVQSR